MFNSLMVRVRKWMNPTMSLDIIVFHPLKWSLMKNVNFTTYISCNIDVVTMYSVCAHICTKKIMLQVSKMPKQMQGKKF